MAKILTDEEFFGIPPKATLTDEEFLGGQTSNPNAPDRAEAARLAQERKRAEEEAKRKEEEARLARAAAEQAARDERRKLTPEQLAASAAAAPTLPASPEAQDRETRLAYAAQLDTDKEAARVLRLQLSADEVAKREALSKTVGPTLKEDATAGILSAQQGWEALSKVAPGIADEASGKYQQDIGTNADQQLADVSREMAQIETAMKDGSQRQNRPQLQARYAELGAERNQLGLALGSGGIGAALAEGKAEQARGRASILEGSANIGEIGKKLALIPTDARMDDFANSTGWIEPLGKFLREPTAITRQAILRSLPAMAPAVVGTVAGTAVAGPVGGAVTGGSISAATEYGMSVSQALSEIYAENKIDSTDRIATEMFLDKNPDIFDGVLQNAATRAGIIGAIDSVSAGTAGWIASAGTATGKAKRAAYIAAGGLVEGFGEGLGELSASVATTGTYNPADVLAETIAGVGMGLPQTAAQMAVLGLKKEGPPPPITLNGGRDRDRLASPLLTGADRSSPIPNDVIDDGKAVLESVINGTGRTTPIQPTAPAQDAGLSGAMTGAPAPVAPPVAPVAQAAPVAPVQNPNLPEGAVPFSTLYGEEEADPADAPIPSPTVEQQDDEAKAFWEKDAADRIAAEEQNAPAPAVAPTKAAVSQGLTAPQVEAAKDQADGINITNLTSEQVGQIETDAKVFQYKDDGDQNGVTTVLQGTKGWDQRSATGAIIYEYADGRRVVADGHQRLGLAKRLQAEGQKTPWTVEIIREVDGYTPADVRTLAALKNIRQGSGTPIDAAKVLRETPTEIEALNLPPTSALVRNAKGLAKLSDDAFGMTVNKVVKYEWAAVVGSMVADTTAHSPIMGLLKKLESGIKNLGQVESIVAQAMQTTATETQTDMFGDTEVTANRYLERAKIIDATMARLKLKGKVFKALLDKSDLIQNAGNQLNQAGNATIVDDVTRVTDYIRSQANMKGPVSDALTAAANQLAANPKAIGEAVKSFLDAINGPEVQNANGTESVSGGAGNQGSQLQGPIPNQEVSPGTPDVDMFGEPIKTAAPAEAPEGDNADGGMFGDLPTDDGGKGARDRDEVTVRSNQGKSGTLNGNSADAGALFEQGAQPDNGIDAAPTQADAPAPDAADTEKQFRWQDASIGDRLIGSDEQKKYKVRGRIKKWEADGLVKKVGGYRTLDGELYGVIGPKSLDAITVRDLLEQVRQEYAAEQEAAPAAAPTQAAAPKAPAAAAPAPAKRPSGLSPEKQARLAELQAAIAAKLRNQTNAGLDPELVSMALESAGLYIESGVRRFRDYALNMLEVTGLKLPIIGRYLRMSYNDQRDEMESNGESVSDMDSSSEVIKELARLNIEINDAEAQAPAPEAAETETAPAPKPAPAPTAQEPQTIADKLRTAKEGGTVEHVTAKGKTLTGYVVDLTKDEAKEVDAYSFKKDDGIFVREAAVTNFLGDAEPDAEPSKTPSKTPDEQTPFWQTSVFKTRLVAGFVQAFASGKDFPTIISARKAVEEYTGKAYAPEMSKTVEEAIELSVVIHARNIIEASSDMTEAQTYERMVELYAAQPNLAQRTSTSVEMQAYSTPVPLAYLASRLAEINGYSVVYEPSAGNGMLLMEASPANIQANELQAERADGLRRALGPDATVTTGDAMTATPAPYDTLITNPPFGKVRNEVGMATVYDLRGLGIQSNEIDHAISALGLDGLPDDGTAVLIIGGQKGSTQEERRDQYTKGGSRAFFKTLYDNYNVTEHFTAAGKLYVKQGAAWPVDVIVIKGKGKSAKPYPMAQAPAVYSTWDSLGERLNGTDSLDTRSIAVGDRDSSNESTDSAPDSGSIPGGIGGQDRPNDTTDGPAGSAGNSTTGGGLRGPVSDSGPIGDGNDTGIRVGDTGGIVGDAGNIVADTNGQNQTGDNADTGGTGGNGTKRLDGPTVSPQRVDRQNDEAETSFQVQYEPRSNSQFAVGTLVPKNMQQAMSRALDALEARVGDIDDYLARKLGYTRDEMLGVMEVRSDVPAAQVNLRLKTADLQKAMQAAQQQTKRGDVRKANLAVIKASQAVARARVALRQQQAIKPVEGKAGYFSAEQMDALALAIDNVEQGKAFIIGDQTGVGKGRFVAAMLRYADRNGMAPVFVSKDGGLYADMIRDMRDIGMADADKSVLITNTNYKGKDVLSLSADPEDNLSSLPPKKLSDAIQHITQKGTLPKGVKYLFTTYSQMQQYRGQTTDRMIAMESIAPRAMFILDESHEAGGVKGAANDTGDGKMPRSVFIRQLLAASQGVVFSSATYAKNPSVMSLYAKTDLSLAVDNIDQLEGMITAGGVPLQQVMANMLVESGQYARRERSFVGVEMGMKEMVTDRAMAERGAEVIRSLFNLDVQVMQDVRENYIKDAAEQGLAGVVDAAVGQAGMSSTNFASTMHNLASQFLLAIKVKAVIAEAVDIHKSGKKPIIALSNTNASIISEAAAEAGVSMGDELNVPFNKILERYLARLRRITVKDEFENKTYIYLTDSQIREHGGAGALDAFNEAKAFIQNSNLSGLPGSPIDAILDGLAKAGINGDEITGRNMTLRSNIMESREASPAAKKRVMRAFNNGDLDALVINRSGSTGFSMHATGRDGNDGKPRHMIILQPEPNIDIFMQMLGRIHRTGQIELPSYTIAVSDLAVEKRPAAVLMRKMASLNANTTANKKSAVSLDNVVDFLNSYGDRVVAEYLRENEMLAIQLDIGVPAATAPAMQLDGLAAKFTGRLVSIHPDEVTRIYNDIEGAYQDYIAALDSMGMNALEAKVLELDARTVTTTEIVEAKDESSPFGQASYVETVDVKRLGKPYSPEQLEAEVEKATDGEDGGSYVNTQLETLRGMLGGAESKLTERLNLALKKLETATTDKQKTAALENIGRINAARDGLQNRFSDIAGMMESLAAGRAGIISQGVGESAQSFAAVSLGIDIKRVTGNPTAASNIVVRIAIADAGKEMRVPISGFFNGDAGYTWREVPNRQRNSVIEAFAAGQSDSRETRQMITGNIPAGFGLLKRGQIIIYTDDNGTLKQGVMLPKNFEAGAELRNRPVKLSAEQVGEFLSEEQGERVVQTDDGIVSISYNGTAYSLLAKKQGHKRYTLNQRVRTIAGDWTERGNKFWRLNVRTPSMLAEVLSVYADNAGVEYQTTTNRNAARAITGEVIPEIESLNDDGAQLSSRDQAASTTTKERRADGYIMPESVADRMIPAMRAALDKMMLQRVKVSAENRRDRQGAFTVDMLGNMNILIGQSVDLMATLYHESIHAMKEMNLFTDAEWSALEAEAAKTWMKKYDIEGRYPNLDRESQIEEAIAEAFGAWGSAKGNGTQPGMIATAFAKMKRMVQAIRNAANGLGFDTSESIFGKAMSGEVGSRPENGSRTFGTKSQAPVSREQQRANSVVSKFVGLPLTNAVEVSTPAKTRQAQFVNALQTQPIDAAFRVPFMAVGGIDQYGNWKYGEAAHNKIVDVITKTDMGYLQPLAEVVRTGMIDRHGQDPKYIERDRKRGIDEALLAAEGAEHIKMLMARKMDAKEAKVLQAVLTGEAVGDADMQALAEPIRKAIDGLGSEAVALGLISRESYEKNRASYLHRVYEKYEFENGHVQKWADKFFGNRRQKIVGDQFKGRGLFEEVERDRIMRDNAEFVGGTRGRLVKGEKVTILELREGDGTPGLNGTDAKKGKLLSRVYWPANKPVPAKLNNYTSRGTFEVRDEKGSKIVLWRDFTKGERTKMGEILDARYTIAKTYQLMSKDLATGRFFKDIAENEEWSRATPPENERVDMDPEQYGYNFIKRIWADPGLKWVLVPDTKISKSQAYRYGALAGRYVRAEIWRDLVEQQAMNKPTFYHAIHNQWKIMKTARSPVVHVNNVMSNFMLMDMADVRVPDLIAGIRSMASGDAAYIEAARNGAFGADMVSQELRDNVLKPLMLELTKDMQGGKGSLEWQFGAIGKVVAKLGSAVKTVDEKMIALYQVEDQVFRMATYIRRREQGMSASEAAVEARDQFLNYDIRAPWINIARRSVLPFVSYTYRAVPKLVETMAKRPWKVAKYIAIYQSLNALAYALAPSDYDEEEERRSLRDGEDGKIGFLGIPITESLMRMPYLSSGNPVFLDVRRWMPAGDVFDTRGGDLPSPLHMGGPMILAMEVYFNRSTFTGEDIFNQYTDSFAERTGKRLKFGYQSFVPNAPWVPGSWYYEKISRAVKGDALEWGSNEPYDILDAIISSAGIKLKPKDVAVGMRSHQITFDRLEREFAYELSGLKRQRERRTINQASYEEAYLRLVEKRNRMRDKKAERFGQ